MDALEWNIYAEFCHGSPRLWSCFRFSRTWRTSKYSQGKHFLCHAQTRWPRRFRYINSDPLTA
jgi:hypothetical protein